jgi:hypothetical protein
MQKATGFRPVALKTQFITKSQAGPLIAVMIIVPLFERMSMRLMATWIIRHAPANAKSGDGSVRGPHERGRSGRTGRVSLLACQCERKRQCDWTPVPVTVAV